MQSGIEHLRDWMRRRSVNQTEAAAIFEVTDVFLSQILNGHRKPGLANAINFERHTGIPVESWLLPDVSGDEHDAVTVGGKPKQAKR